MNQKTFDWFASNFNLTLLESELHDINLFVNKSLTEQLAEEKERYRVTSDMMVKFQRLSISYAKHIELLTPTTPDTKTDKGVE